MIAATWVVLELLFAAAPAQALALERDASAHIRREFERVGRAAPAADASLQVAARALAREALSGDASRAADLEEVAARVSAAGGADFMPRVMVVRATTPAAALASFQGRADLNEEPASHLGIGAAVSPDHAVVVSLLAERRATLRPFRRTLPRAGGSRKICGELSAGLSHPEVFITRPSGNAEKVPLASQAGSTFCAVVPFAAAGRHAVEVAARSQRGPEVVLRFHVDVGAPPRQAREVREAPAPEPSTLEASRQTILQRINALRSAQGAPEVTGDGLLDGVAQGYAEQMLREGFFGHVSPSGENVTARLGRAGYQFLYAGENLGLASGPLGAHSNIEHSPGHRRNLLSRDFTAVGIGVVWDRDREPAQVLLVEVLAQPSSPVPVPDPLEATYRVLDDLRAQARLPPLKRSQALERIAISHARQALQRNAPVEHLPGLPPVHDRVFDVLGGVQAASVDVYVAPDPSAVHRSENVTDARNDWVGVGAVRGDSPTFGKQKYWVVVIYASTR